MMFKASVSLLIAAILLPVFFSCSSPKGINRVWAIDESEKIKRDDISNPLASDLNNKVWVNNTVNLFGAKNEIVAFQLIIEAGKTGAKDVNVVISDLLNGESKIPGSANGSPDPFDYRGRNMELFTENYFNIEKRSPPLWFYAKGAAPSDYYTGWVPDCLIPFSAPPGKGGAPFPIDSASNQGVWVDILIPKNSVSGTYQGTITVTETGKTYKKIPLILNVFDFTLPDSTHIKNMFGLYDSEVARRHGVKNGSKEYYELEGKYYQLAHRHRFDLVRRVNNLEDMTNYQKRYLTGEYYTSQYGYAGPGENVGNTTFSIGYGGSVPDEYGRRPKLMTKSLWWKGSDAWEEWFVKNAPNVERHKYLYPDEPDFKGPEGKKGIASMDTIRMQAKWTHTNPGIGRNIPVLVTNTFRPGLMGHVDFWSISTAEAMKDVTPEVVASEKAKGKKFGVYNGYRPGFGAVITDGDAVEFRVMPWIVWKYNVDQYFYWSATYWTRTKLFTDPLTYRRQVNGDGTFLYPGQDSVHVEENRNLAGPLSSIRAKNWRRGAQDFEYLWLAKQAGLDKEIRAIADSCVPAALWEAKGLSNISWSNRGYKFEQYRKELAELISKRVGKK